MSASSAFKGYFTVLQLSDGGGTPTFTTIAEIFAIGGPQLSRALPEATHMESDDGYREFIGGLCDATQFTAELNFIPTNATQADLLTNLAAVNSTSKRTYRIVLPNKATSLTTTASTTTFTATSHGFNTAQPIQFTTSGTIPTALRVGKFYYARRLSANTYSVHATCADAIANSNAISGSGGSGTLSVWTGTTFTFTAIVSGLAPKYPLADRITATATFKLSGKSTPTNIS